MITKGLCRKVSEVRVVFQIRTFVTLVLTALDRAKAQELVVRAAQYLYYIEQP